MFAGSGAATKTVQEQGYKSAHLDLRDASQYGLNESGSVFDILSPVSRRGCWLWQFWTPIVTPLLFGLVCYVHPGP